MLPVILCCPDKAQSDKIIATFIENNAVLPTGVHLIQREDAPTGKGKKKKEIAVSQMRALNQLFYHHHSQTRVIIIEDFDTASEEAQNALLKILEEKTENTQFYLLVKNYLKVLPTIRSRSTIQTIQNTITPVEVQETSAVAIGLLEGNIELLGHPSIQGITAEKVLELIDEVLIALRARLKENAQKGPVLMKELLRVKQLVQQNNLNPQLAIDYILLSQNPR